MNRGNERRKGKYSGIKDYTVCSSAEEVALKSNVMAHWTNFFVAPNFFGNTIYMDDMATLRQ